MVKDVKQFWIVGGDLSHVFRLKFYLWSSVNNVKKNNKKKKIISFCQTNNLKVFSFVFRHQINV